MDANNQPQWLLALESSTPHGGSALLKDGLPHAKIQLQEGLRHGRELLASAQSLLKNENLTPKDLLAVAVSIGPGSYTGIRVGTMAAKALAYAANCQLATVSSLAALAQTSILTNSATNGDTIAAVQNARRDEVYTGLYSVQNNTVDPIAPDTAMTPEEAALLIQSLEQKGAKIIRAGSSFKTYQTTLTPPSPLDPDVTAALGALLGSQTPPSSAAPNDGRVDPDAVGILGWRQILQANTADPMTVQPIYAQRNPDSDWRHDHLITGTK